jgi:hypothetical protein
VTERRLIGLAQIHQREGHRSEAADWIGQIRGVELADRRRAEATPPHAAIARDIARRMSRSFNPGRLDVPRACPERQGAHAARAAGFVCQVRGIAAFGRARLLDGIAPVV